MGRELIPAKRKRRSHPFCCLFRHNASNRRAKKGA